MNPVAVIIGAGASQGLGAALARRFSSGGLHVVLAGRTREKLAARASEIVDAGGAAEICVADTRQPEDVDRLFSLAESLGPLEAVLYNAGNNAIIPFSELTAESFEKFWRICCLGGFLVAHRCLPTLLERGHGSLIFTGASASLRGKANFAHFASAKGALRNLAQSLAREYGPRGIHVAHVIVDGVIDGEMVRSQFREYLEKLGPDALLNPDEMAESFWFLHRQPRSAWTHELDLRPFKEKW